MLHCGDCWNLSNFNWLNRSPTTASGRFCLILWPRSESHLFREKSANNIIYDDYCTQTASHHFHFSICVNKMWTVHKDKSQDFSFSNSRSIIICTQTSRTSGTLISLWLWQNTAGILHWTAELCSVMVNMSNPKIACQTWVQTLHEPPIVGPWALKPYP